MKNVNLIFWVKAISLVANFGSTRSALTSVDHKQRIKKSNSLTPRPPPPLALTTTEILKVYSKVLQHRIFDKTTLLSEDIIRITV